MPVLPAPEVPVEACSRRHFARSSPVSVSHRPLLDPAEAGPLAVPLAVTLDSEELGDRGAVVPAAPAASPLVPVEGVVVPMPEPDWICAKAGHASSAAAVAVQSSLSFMEMLL
jgi:hypothetical protein